jgi:hypothetical protein
MPEPAPVAPLPARDDALIALLAGPKPVEPTPQAPSLLQKIALALQGFGAGTQGQGPQFLAGLREERERPQREFKAATDQYEQRRAGAVEFAERRRASEQEQTQRRADEQSEREFRHWVQRTGATDARALEELRQSFETQRDARRAESERVEQERRELAQRRRDAGLIARDAAKLGAAPQLAKEIGEYWAGIRESLSPAAAKFESTQARLAEMRLRGASSGGRTGASNAAMRVAQEIEAAKGELISLQQRGSDPRRERAIRTRIDKAIGRARAFPGQLLAGFGEGDWPFVKYWNGREFVGLVNDGGAAPGTQQQRTQMDFDLTGDASQGPTDAEVQAYARRFNIPVEQARQELARQ